MTTARNQMTLQDYLAYDDGTDKRYELVDGELIEMPPESDRNNLISLYLLSEFLKLVPLSQLRHKDTELVVTGERIRVRLPDLMVLTEELASLLRDVGRSTITQDMPPPALVVEVVSPGKTNEDRDYRYKRSEYAARGILEYWIVDPSKLQITVLTLVAGFYEEAIFRGGDRIQSSTFPTLQLTAQTILAAGN